jgi:hypothetical protein
MQQAPLRKQFPQAEVVHSLFEEFKPRQKFNSIVLGACGRSSGNLAIGQAMARSQREDPSRRTKLAVVASASRSDYGIAPLRRGDE